jgi:C-terminal processing protease CtpA/Prc
MQSSKFDRSLIALMTVLILAALACNASDFNFTGGETPDAQPTSTSPISGDFNLQSPITGGNEPVVVTGTVPFTSPFFLAGASQPFVMLEDQAGFVARDIDFNFPLEGQAIGPVWQIDDGTMGFSLSLPGVPQGTLVDVDNNGSQDTGVMVFAVAYWSNTWGGPFLEDREGSGWSGASASTLTDPDRDYEISGGKLVIWAPDDAQSFPAGFGPDNMLFTEDDPVQPVPAGYSIVDLDVDPFNVYKEAAPEMVLPEGASQVKDYSGENYADAFDMLFEKVSVEYPFTADKNVDWDALYSQYAPRFEDARNFGQYYRALHDFTLEIPDAHIGVTFDAQVFFDDWGGSFGLLLAELSDGRVIVTQVFDGLPGKNAGIQVGAEITQWDGRPILDAVADVEPFLGPYSTDHARRAGQLVFVTRMSVGESVDVTFKNPNGSAQTVTMQADTDYDSLFASLYYFNQDTVLLPIEAQTLENGIVYIKINTFLDDYVLMAKVWQRYIENMIENETPALILDLRENGGGNGGLALDFAGFFFEETVDLSRGSYYNYESGQFEYNDYERQIEPAPIFWDGPIAVLVGKDCVSACEGFSYAMAQSPNVTIFGHTPSAGAYGEVGRGQYTMPGDLSVQYPTGRPETPDGDLLIEGVGVTPDQIVPVTFESALGQVDAVLQAALDFLNARIN